MAYEYTKTYSDKIELFKGITANIVVEKKCSLKSFFFFFRDFKVTDVFFFFNVIIHYFYFLIDRVAIQFIVQSGTLLIMKGGAKNI